MKRIVKNRRQKVLVIAYVFPPIAYVGTYRTLRFCRYLPENGWEPCVLTINETKDLENDYKLLERLPTSVKIYRTPTIDFWRIWNARKKRKKKHSNQNDKQVRGDEVKKKKSVKPSLLDRMKDVIWEILTVPDHMVFWIPFAIVGGIYIQIKEKCDVIYTSSPPHSEQLTGLIISKLFKRPWVADFRDPMLDSSGYQPKYYLRSWIDRKIEKAVVNNANKILIISEHYRKLMVRRYPYAQEKFVTFPNGYDPEIYKNVRADDFNKFTILYSGTFYANRNPIFFLRTFSQWLKEKTAEVRKNIQVHFYGPLSSIALAIVNEENLSENVFFKGMIPQDELIPKQKGAHLLLVVVAFDSESKGTVTSKIFEYIACKRPILAIIPPGDAADILKNYPKIFIVDREEPQLLKQKLDQAFEVYENELNADQLTEEIPYSIENPEDLFNARNQTMNLSYYFSDLSG